MSKIYADNLGSRSGGDITISNNVNITGILSATSYVGAGINISEDGSIVGTAITNLNFVGSSVASEGASTITITSTAPNDITSSLFS